MGYCDGPGGCLSRSGRGGPRNAWYARRVLVAAASMELCIVIIRVGMKESVCILECWRVVAVLSEALSTRRTQWSRSQLELARIGSLFVRRCRREGKLCAFESVLYAWPFRTDSSIFGISSTPSWCLQWPMCCYLGCRPGDEHGKYHSLFKDFISDLCLRCTPG